MNKRFSIYYLTGLLAVLSACSSEENNRQFKIFRYNESSGIASLDPAFARNQSIMWAVHQLYNTLIEVDDQLHVKPGLAKSWSISEDGKTIDFSIRTDVYFHDNEVFPNGKGRKMIASDVVYSFQRLIDPATASPGAWIFNTRVEAHQPFTALNDSTFRLQLKEAFLPMLGVLSMKYCSVVPKEAVEKYGDAFRKHPVGTGPFQFVVWNEGQALILQKNPHYYELDSLGVRLPYLDGIKVSFLENKANEFVQFRQHRLDFINDIDPAFKDEVLTRAGNLKATWKDKLQLHKGPYLNVEYIGILTDTVSSHPIQSPLIRRAMNYAIPKEKLLMYMRNSIGMPANDGFVPPGFDHASRYLHGYAYSPDSARAIMQRTGYNNEEIVFTTVPQYAAIGTFIAGELQQVGFNIRLEQVPKAVLLQRTARGEMQFFRGSWIGDYPSEENFLSVFYGKNPAPPNYTRYQNKQFDQWYETAMNESNDLVRRSLYRQMDSCIVADLPVIPLWYDMVIHLVQSNIRNFKTNPLNMLELRNVKKD